MATKPHTHLSFDIFMGMGMNQHTRARKTKTNVMISLGVYYVLLLQQWIYTISGSVEQDFMFFVATTNKF